jgi:hypothetical protein
LVHLQQLPLQHLNLTHCRAITNAVVLHFPHDVIRQ